METPSINYTLLNEKRVHDEKKKCSSVKGLQKISDRLYIGYAH